MSFPFALTDSVQLCGHLVLCPSYKWMRDSHSLRLGGFCWADCVGIRIPMHGDICAGVCASVDVKRVEDDERAAQSTHSRTPPYHWSDQNRGLISYTREPGLLSQCGP